MKKLKKANSSVKQPQPEVSGIVVSGDISSNGRKTRLKSKKSAIILGVVVGLLLLVGSGLYVFNRDDAPIKQPLSSEIDRAYDTTEKQNIPLLLAYDYDLTIEKLETTDYAQQLDTYKEARNVATALVRFAKFDRALVAYRTIDTRFSNEAGYDFYLEFCGIAYRAGDKDLSYKMCDKSIEKAAKLELRDIEKAAIIDGIKLTRDSLEEQTRGE